MKRKTLSAFCMKAIFLVTAIMLTINFSIFASVTEENRQKIFPVGSDVYDAIKQLYISEGLALPSTTGPWSAKELDMMLDRINPEKLSDDEISIYYYINSSLNEGARWNPDEIFGLTMEGIINFRLYMHSNRHGLFSSPDYWGGRDIYNQPTPLVNVPLETWIGKNVYGYVELSLGNSRSLINNTVSSETDIGNGNSVTSISYNGMNAYSNIFMMPPAAGFSDFDLNFPYRAFGSIGSDWWNISIGRDKLSWGPGESGNFAIGDHIPYHNNVRFTAFTKSFKYTLSASFFVHPMNYFTDNGAGIYYFNSLMDQDKSRNGVNMFLAHRLEWRIFEKVNMALTEAVMYQNDNFIDPLVFSPTTIFHNFYIRGNANSLLTLEIDYTPLEHWNVYAQVALDDLSLPGESTAGSEDPPTALGYMVGAKVSFPHNDGVIYSSFEAVYTDPWLYIRDSGERNGDKYGNSFIVAIPEWVNMKGNQNYDLNYLGYKYGGDSVVCYLKAGYKKYGSWFLEGSFTYVAHGTINLFTRPGKGQEHGLTSTPPSSGSYLPGSSWASMNAIEHTFVTSIKGGITFFDDLDLVMELTLMNIINPGNIRENPAAHDFQVTIGASYTL